MLVGHAVIIHDRTGARVACALQGEDMPPMCPEGCQPMMMGRRRTLLFSSIPVCPGGCEPIIEMM
jgi:hypothetical protein